MADPVTVIHSIDDDADSALGDDTLSSISSLSAGASDFPLEYGRTYHRYCDGAYLYPNDEEEQKRLDFQHHFFGLLYGGKLFLAPVEDPQEVLELGTGTGIWAIDFADSHPCSRVLGVDLSPIQPGWIPPNCCFNVFNYEREWQFRRRFDFIFCRPPIGWVQNPDKLLKQVFAHLQPGGWFEIQSAHPPLSDDNTIPSDSSYRVWIDNYCEALEQAGRDPHLARKYVEKLAAAEFVEIEVFVDKVPQNPWPKGERPRRLGHLNEVNTIWAIEGLSLRPFLTYRHWQWDELQVLLAAVRKDIKDQNIHAYWPLRVLLSLHGVSTDSSNQIYCVRSKTCHR